MPLYVSRVASICLSAANGRVGAIAIDRKTGAPLRGGTLKPMVWIEIIILTNSRLRLSLIKRATSLSYLDTKYGNYSCLTVRQ